MGSAVEESRPDLEVPEEVSLRPIKCELNVLSRPDGSAILAQGNTVVMAAVYGPDESRLNRLQFEKVSFDALFQSKSGSAAETNTAYDSAIKSACIETLYPKVYARSDISLIVQEMQNRGSMLACAINAGCLALLNTGLEMKCLVGAVTSMIGPDGKVVIDPDDEASEVQ
ncbi:hypothetical protein AAG570_009221 [Ranatra chinensis]|uniref:Exoribonuclease phosphorolytic domain-containing protein n=1 Tax=Ranatra chinensis TaxID=642074 RepID=A0ABD0YTT6_9HEMI